MKYHKPVSIVASGKYLPARVSSDELERRYSSLPKGFAEQFSGVRSRCQVTFESNGYMGARAIEAALANARLSLGDIDLIIAAGATFDYPLPSQASVIKHELSDGHRFNLPTFDIDSTCLSFVTAFEVAAKMLDGVQYRKIVIVSAEVASKGLNTKNPETLSLFGDGAAAFILAFDENSDSSFIKAYFKTYSEGLYHSIIRGGGNVHYFRDHPYDELLYSFEMNGIKLLKLAKTALPDFMQMILDDLSIQLPDIDVIIPHQASRAGIQLFKRIFELGDDQVKENIGEYGNCIAASIPLLLHDCLENGEIRRGDLCMLFGTSAGFSIGALLFTY